MGFGSSSSSFGGFQVYSSLQHAFSEAWTATAEAAWPFFALLAMLSERLTGSSVATENASAPEGLWKAWLSSAEWSPPAMGPQELPGEACDAETALLMAQRATEGRAEAVRALAQRCLQEMSSRHS